MKLPTGGYSPQAVFFIARTGEIPVPTVTVRMREDVLRAIYHAIFTLFCVMHLGRLVLSGTNDKKVCFFMSTQTRARKLTVTAMLSTIAFILMYIEFPIPALIPSFVKLDISDLPELLAAFSLGPVYGVVVSLLKLSLIHI